MSISMKYTTKTFFTGALLLAVVFGIPGTTFASSSSSDIEVSGWVPYWVGTTGTTAAINHMDTFSMINPFTYTLKTDGTPYANADLKKGVWDDMLDEAKDADVDIVPTIMNGSGEFMHGLLSDDDTREEFVEDIASLVKKNRWNGIDIDFEGKKADTREYFADFVKELNSELSSSKKLVCTIEARTPPASLYRVIPANLEYANDYKAIGKYCDIVQIMTYDQGRADLLLNEKRSGSPYIPIADNEWVEKVIQLAIKDIPKSKIMLGVATYGHEYNVTVAPNWFKEYKKTQSVNPAYALASSANLKIEPYRTGSGELAITYPNTGTPIFDKTITVPAGTQPGAMVAQQSLAYANKTGKTVTFSMIWWSDSQAIEDKIELAEKYDLRGVSLFSIDGKEDPDMWEVLGQ